MAQELQAQRQVLVFKAQLPIKQWNNRWHIGRRSYPLNLFGPSPDGDASKLILNPGWTLESGEVLVDDFPGLHRRISPSAPAEDARPQHVPSEFLLRIIPQAA